ncbi:MAG: NosD domain-containing protein [Candidatus Krumholzibacteriaceae bacterium]
MLLLVSLLVAVLAPAAWTTTYEVWPDGRGLYPTIQDAVNACAASGDAVAIHGGVYHQTGIIVSGKSITMTESTGEQAFMISPAPLSGTCITFSNSTSFTLGSLEFRGYATGVAVGGSSSGYIQFVTVQACGRGVAISGAATTTMWYSIVDSCGTAVEVQGGSPTLRNETIVYCTTGALFSGGSAAFSRSIVYGCGTGVQCSGGSATLSCNDFYINTADYDGCTAGAGDFYTDPMFCFWASSAGPYWLHSSSPCLARANPSPCNVYIGAITSGPGCTGTAVEHTTWGSIKNIYR